MHPLDCIREAEKLVVSQWVYFALEDPYVYLEEEPDKREEVIRIEVFEGVELELHNVHIISESRYRAQCGTVYEALVLVEKIILTIGDEKFEMINDYKDEVRRIKLIIR